MNIMFKKQAWCLKDASVSKGVCRNHIQMEERIISSKLSSRPPHACCGMHSSLTYVCRHTTCTHIQIINAHFKKYEKLVRDWLRLLIPSPPEQTSELGRRLLKPYSVWEDKAHGVLNGFVVAGSYFRCILRLKCVPSSLYVGSVMPRTS